MDLESIVYKKNAYVDLKQDLEKYYYGKRILLISTKSLVNNFLTEIMNCISLAKCSFKHFIAKNNFSNIELRKLSDILTQENFDLYIVFGGGRATSVTKYFANIFCVPYFVCPSSCSNISYFSNICINPYDCTRTFKCDYPERIYINEMVIKTNPRNLIKQGIMFIMSMQEILAIQSIENILFDQHKNYDEISKVMDKLKKELNNILTGDVDSKLIVMDMLIDLAQSIDENNLWDSSLFNLYSIMQKVFENKNEIVGSGETFLLASKTLLLCYNNLFSQKKIKRLEMPNYIKIVKNIENNGIFYKKINNLAFFNQILSKQELLIRLNNLKEEFNFQTKKRLNEQNEMLNLIKSYDDVFMVQPPKIKDVFTCLNVLPYVCENNYIVPLLGGMGFCNAF